MGNLHMGEGGVHLRATLSLCTVHSMIASWARTTTIEVARDFGIHASGIVIFPASGTLAVAL